eukprot:1414711-Rhodomonas_salina.1
MGVILGLVPGLLELLTSQALAHVLLDQVPCLPVLLHHQAPLFFSVHRLSSRAPERPSLHLLIRTHPVLALHAHGGVFPAAHRVLARTLLRAVVDTGQPIGAQLENTPRDQSEAHGLFGCRRRAPPTTHLTCPDPPSGHARLDTRAHANPDPLQYARPPPTGRTKMWAELV